jgi:hypothetical protein
MPLYEIDTKNLGFATPEEKNLEKALRGLGEIKYIKTRGKDLTYVIETKIRIPHLIKEKIKKIDAVEGIGKPLNL